MTNNYRLKYILPLFIFLLLSILLYHWIKYSALPGNNTLLLLTIIFLPPLLLGIKNEISIRNSVPLQDEMTRRIDVYAAAKSFNLSLYSWFVIYIFRSRFDSSGKLIFAGFMISVALLATTRLYYRIRGLPDENQT